MPVSGGYPDEQGYFFSYHFREPKRWEVTVFKYPLDLSKNFIKRMVGVGPGLYSKSAASLIGLTPSLTPEFTSRLHQ